MTPEFVAVESASAPRSVTGLSPCRGLYWKPPGVHPPVAFIVSHYDEDLSEHYLAERLVQRGYGVLGWNTRYTGQPQHFSLPHALLDIAAGVRWLRMSARAEVIVMFGNSGGGSLSVVYQAEATQPTGIVEEVRTSSDEILEADAVITLNAHAGRPEWLASMLDPSVTDEADPLSRDTEVDLYADGRTVPLDGVFVERYRTAQRARSGRISAWVNEEQQRLQASGVKDRLFAVHRVWADPRFIDLSIDPSNRSAGCFLGDPKRANEGVYGPARTCTFRSWREMWDLEGGRCSALRHGDRVAVPALVVQSLSDQGVFPSDARAIHTSLGSTDKSLQFIEGDHFLRDDSAKDEAVGVIDAWMGSRW